MKYKAWIKSDTSELKFDFEADSNALAEAHLWHATSDPALWKPFEITRLHFIKYRRWYATNWRRA